MELPSLPLLLAFLLFLLTLVKIMSNTSKAKSLDNPLPPGPWKLPLIGHLHLLVRDLPFRVFADLSAQYGPDVMMLTLGQVNLAVVSSRDAAEEVLKTQDLNFAYRPELALGSIMEMSMGFSPYGSHWKQLRKVFSMELFSNSRVRSFADIRREQVLGLMRDIAAAANGEPINLSLKLLTLMNNIVSTSAFGNKCRHHDAVLVAVEQAASFASGFMVADLFPSLKFIDVLTGMKGKLDKVSRDLDMILDEIIRDHQLHKADKVASKDEDLIDVFLRLKDLDDSDSATSLRTMKAVILEIFLGGTETSASTVEWAMTELMRNPRAMEKAQKEVREAREGKTKIEESDPGQLSYLKLVVKETLRIHLPGPLLLPREAKQTCQVLGYTIPAGTRTVVNAWAIGRDSRYWDDAEIFRPERFDGSQVDFKGTHFQFMPFGGGRRICPGMGFGLASAEHALAQLLLHFDWKLPDGVKPEELDMAETFGSSARRRSPLYVIPTPHAPLPDA